MESCIRCRLRVDSCQLFPSGDQSIIQYKLRPAGKDDQRPIRSLIRAAGINPLGLSWSRFIVAVDEQGQLVGCGQVKVHRDGSRELASIAVVRQWRRQGVASAIIRELQEGYGRPLWLTCIGRLVPFYEPYGFVEISDLEQMPSYFRRAKRFFNLYLKLRRATAQLAVMVWE
jgi:GNAT superfamily N-acetyltransferase